LAFNKLYELLLDFNDKQLKEFSAFASFGLHNKNEKLSYITNKFTEAIANNNINAIDKCKLHKHLFKTKEYNDLQMRHLFTEVYELALNYISFSSFKNDRFQKSQYLLQHLNQPSLTKHFNHELKRTAKTLSSQIIKDKDYYYQQFSIQQLISMHTSSEQARTGNSNNQNLHKYLDAYYVIQKLMLACAELNNQLVVKNENDEQAFMPDNTLIEKCIDIPLVRIYNQLYHLLQNPNNNDEYDLLKNIIETESKSLSKKDLKQLYSFLLNFCVQRINHGNQQYLKELFLVYKNALEFELIFEQGVLSPWHYKNIVTISIRVSEIEWANWFTITYKSRLDKNEADNAYLFNSAKLAFAAKDYKTAMVNLQQVNLSDLFYALDARVLLMKVYYELDEFEATENLVLSFSQLLRRKKLLSKRHQVNYKNFIKFYKKLKRLQYQKTDKAIWLRDQVSGSDHIADKSWILNKIEEHIY